MVSLILTVHNKDFLLQSVLDGIKNNTSLPYELIIVLDGCSDSSKAISEKFSDSRAKIKIIETPDVFETKANNSGLKLASSEFVCVIQDDMVIKEPGWDSRMLSPFFKFGDVFAVTANCAHNWEINPSPSSNNSGWSDLLFHCDHANRKTVSRDTFAVRQCVNRGPLLINHSDLIKMNYFDESFSPQDMDDHDLCFRMREKLGKSVGCYWIDYESDSFWGGTREAGQTKQWLLDSNRKNCKIVLDRHAESIKNKIIDDRKC